MTNQSIQTQKLKMEHEQKTKMSPLYNVPVSEKYFIVGKFLTKEETEKLGLPWKKAGPGEVWIEIPKKLIDEKGK